MQGEPVAGSAAEFIVRAAAEHPGEVVVLMLAALTNLALALQLDPGLPERLVSGRGRLEGGWTGLVDRQT